MNTSVVDIRTSVSDIGKLATSVIFSGCDLGCSNCFNNILKTRVEGFSYENIYKKLEERKSLTDWVVYYGGEPTMEENLDDLIEIAGEAALMGYKQFLFTGRTYEELINICDVDELYQLFDYIKVGPYLDTCNTRVLNIPYFFGSINQSLLRTNGEDGYEIFYGVDRNTNEIFGRMVLE